MSFQYKTSSGGSLADVPTYAQGDAGSEGGLTLRYPAAAERDGLGRPCGAVGRPEIVLAAPRMRGDGMAWWQALFALTTDESVTLWLTAPNPRTGSWATYTGYLLRPTYERVEPGASATGTVYTGVTVRMVECVAT